MSDHGAKRQRLTGSFSPASPPYHQVAKPSDQTKPVVHPNTPTSPPYISMNSQPNGGSAMAPTAPSSEMTPPSSVHMSQQLSQSAASASASIPHPFPTPGSTTGLASCSNVDSDGDAMMADSADDDGDKSSEHRHSNHNRQSRGSPSGKEAASGAQSAAGGSLFRLCQNPHPVSRPHGSQNLFELYGLNDLARSVARTDPVSGEKINKLRKSYEGHIKAMQIAGKPKAVKLEGKFTELMWIPEGEPYEQIVVKSKPLATGLDPTTGGLTSDYNTLLDSAFAGIAPGPLPPSETQKYRAYLGTDEVSKPRAGGEGPANRAIQPTAATPVASNPTPASRASRPERSGSKRSYTDVSFQGYGEGFGDEFADSTGGEDNGQGGMSKKRRLGFERTSHQVEVGGVRR